MYDESKALNVIWLDFQKVFDKVLQLRLLAKIRSHGIDWVVLWLLKNRVTVHIKMSVSSFVIFLIALCRKIKMVKQ